MDSHAVARQPQAADVARLQRAAALAPADRSPEVCALLEAAQLADQIDGLLPLGAVGRAALPDSPAARQRVLRAMLKVLLADCRCPEHPPQRPAMLDRLGAYMHCIAPASRGSTGSSSSLGSGSSCATSATADGSVPQPSDAAVEADCEALAEVLRLYLTASQCKDDFEGLQMATEAAAMLAAPNRQEAVARALQHLAAAEAADARTTDTQQAQQGQEQTGPQLGLPTLRQLRYACCYLVAECSLQVAAMSHPSFAAATAPLTAEQREVLQAAEESSISELFELEPDNPKGVVAAALALSRCGPFPERVAEVYLTAHRLAVEQGSDWWAVTAATGALAHVAKRPAAADGDTLAAAVAAFQQAKPALKRCRRLLPPAWVRPLEAFWDVAERLLPAASQHVQQAAGQQQGPDADLAAAGPASAAGIATQAAECAYCGEASAALRCARCRREVYCSRDCQRSAWQKHKRTCQPAA